MNELTKKIIDYCKNNDTYNFNDSVDNINAFSVQTRDLILFDPDTIITYLGSMEEPGAVESKEILGILKDINNISYENLINGFIDNAKSYKLEDVKIMLDELLSKKLYKRFIALSLAYIIIDTLFMKDHLLFKNNQISISYIVTQFNKINIKNKTVLSILDNIDYKYSYDELAAITNKIRNSIILK